MLNKMSDIRWTYLYIWPNTEINLIILYIVLSSMLVRTLVLMSMASDEQGDIYRCSPITIPLLGDEKVHQENG